MRIRIALAALLIAAHALGAAADAREPGATIVAFGRYESQLNGTQQKAERTAAGVIEPASRFTLLERTDVVVGQLGNSFGIEIRLENFRSATAPLTIRTLHPPLTNPATGKTTSVSEYDWNVGTQATTHFTFHFGRQWLIAEGPWTLQILHRGRVIAEKSFKVVILLN